MSVITQGAFPKNKRPGVFAFTQMAYKDHPMYWKQLFHVSTSNMMYEEAVAGNTFGMVPAKSEGNNIQYASESQAHTTRSTHVVYAMGYQITYEEALNDLYEKLGKRRGGRLAKAFARTKETVHANLFNRAFNSSYTFGDGKELCATDHPTMNGNQSNELATSADMSEASIEDLCIQIRKATDNVGNKIDLRPVKMVYAPDESFNACRILESELKNDTAENAVNALKSKGKIPEHMDNPYFDDADAFFILTDIAQTEEGLVHFERAPFQVDMDNDSDTLNEKHFGFEYYSRTAFDFRAVFGSPGA
jgi:hypothetical protein